MTKCPMCQIPLPPVVEDGKLFLLELELLHTNCVTELMDDVGKQLLQYDVQIHWMMRIILEMSIHVWEGRIRLGEDAKSPGHAFQLTLAWAKSLLSENIVDETKAKIQALGEDISKL